MTGPDSQDSLASADRSVLTLAQQGILYAAAQDSQPAAYNMALAWRIAGVPTGPRLDSAWRQLATRHSALRTRLSPGEHDEIEAIRLPAPEVVRWCGLDSAPGTSPAADVEAMSQQEAHRPFDLDADVLARCAVFRIGGGEILLVITLHHMIADARSMDILARDFAEAFNCWPAAWTANEGHAERWPTPGSAQLAESAERRLQERAVELRECLSGQAGGEGSRVRDAHGRHARGSETPGPLLEFVLTKDESERIRDLGRHLRSSASMFVTAAMSLVLSRIERIENVVVGVPFDQRGDLDAGEIGLFINIVPIAVRNINTGTVRSLIQRVRHASLTAYRSADIPFESIVEAVNPVRRGPLSPIVQALTQVYYERAASQRELTLHGFRTSRIQLAAQSAHFGIEFNVIDDGRVLGGTLNVDARLYDATAAKAILESLLTVLRTMAAQPDMEVANISLSAGCRDVPDPSPDGQRDQIRASQDGPARIRQEVGILETIAEIAARSPQSTAVSDDLGLLSFAELADSARRLAARLAQERYSGSVAICAGRSRQWLVAMLAAWHAGLTAVPLNSEDPTTRLRDLCGDAQIEAILTARAVNMNQLRSLRRRIVSLDVASEGNRQPDGDKRAAAAGAPGYIVFTSGSSGRAKGVLVPERNLYYLREGLHRILERANLLESGTLNWGLFASTMFDACFQAVAGLSLGSSVHIISEKIRSDPEALMAFFRSREVHIADLNPVMARALLPELRRDTGSLRCLLVGGEYIDDGLWRELARLPITCVNVYGPTEATVNAAWSVIEGESTKLGAPWPGARLAVLDHTLNPLPDGLEGELAIGGCGLAFGYVSRARLTAARFVPAPTVPGGRRYLTRDRVRVAGNGELTYHGRYDSEVKLRGHRVNLAEVDRAVGSLDGVIEAVAVIGQDEESLDMAVVLSSACTKDGMQLARELRQELPAYMIPSRWFRVDSLAKSTAGKPLRIITDGTIMRQAQARSTAPRDAKEELIFSLWTSVLERHDFGIHDDFFDLGGSSLRGIRLINAMRRALAVPIPLWSLVKFPTIAGIAGAYGSARAPRPSGSSGHVPPSAAGRILVTGATGRIGRYIVGELLRDGWDVCVLARPESASQTEQWRGVGAAVVTADLADGDRLARMTAEAHGIIHAAWSFGQDEIDVTAVKSLLAGWAAGPFIFLSSASVYGVKSLSRGGGMAAERVTSSYGRLKRHCEQLITRTAQDRGLRAVSLRVPHVFGPDDRFAEQARWVDFPDLIRRLEAGSPCMVSDALTRQSPRPGINWIDSRDLAKAVVSAVAGDISGVFDVTGGRIDWIDVIAELASILRSESAVEFVPSEAGPVLDFFDEDRLDIGSSRAVLAETRFRDWRATFRDMLARGGEASTPEFAS